MVKEKNLIAKILILLTLSVVSFCANAYTGKKGPWHRGDIRYFEFYDHGVWRGGQWRHTLHFGHMGWWWVVGPSWYYYSKPVYPYPDPYMPSVALVYESTQETPAETTVQNWYYCEASREYYPYVPACPQGWTVVPATPASIGPK